MKVAYYEVGKKPKIIEIKNTLDEMQKLVGGYIEQKYLKDNVYVIWNEEAYLIGLDVNRYCSIINHTIRGNFFLCETTYDGSDFASITDEQFNRVKGYFR